MIDRLGTGQLKAKIAKLKRELITPSGSGGGGGGGKSFNCSVDNSSVALWLIPNFFFQSASMLRVLVWRACMLLSIYIRGFEMRLWVLLTLG